jgi:hypothetical protein
MRCRPILLGSVLLLIGAAIDLSAKADDNRYIHVELLGAGASSCGTWTADRSAKTANDDVQWVLGFLSAYNTFGPDPSHNISHSTDVNGVLGWIDNYCREHPLAMMVEAVTVFIKTEETNH